MQLASKMRFVAAQFVALLTDELWLRSARHANAMARRLGVGSTAVPGVGSPTRSRPTACSPCLPAVTAALQADYPFYVWDEATGVVRWMTSFDTTEADVDGFVPAGRALAERAGAAGVAG